MLGGSDMSQTFLLCKLSVLDPFDWDILMSRGCMGVVWARIQYTHDTPGCTRSDLLTVISFPM